MSDLSSIFIWWLTIFAIGITSLPLTSLLFKKFIDRGYIFSKVLGILISSYLVWLLASLHLLPFAKFTIILILLGLAIVNFYLLGKEKFRQNLKFPIKWIVLEEILFFLGLAFWSYVRATEPSIRGLEKFMDFGFVNSILRASYFPPLDMWLTKSPDYTGGYFINYYYFGHYVMAFLTKISGIDAAITYNLMMATLFAFTFTLPFCLGANLFWLFQKIKGRENFKGSNNKSRVNDDASISRGTIIACVVAGLLAAYLVSLGGNPHTLYVLTSGYPNEDPVPPWTLSFGYHPDRYWYPNATRFIPNTIHEFPIYSFVVADLHGHVSDIPFVFLTLALLLSLLADAKHKNSDSREKESVSGTNPISKFLTEFENHTSIPIPKIILLGLLLGVMYMTNAWDGLIYLVVAVLVILYLNLYRKSHNPNFSLSSALYKTISATLFLLFFFLVANFPFTLNFKPFVSGIGFLCSPKFLLEKKIGPLLFETDKCQKSPIYMMVILWGFFYYNVIGYFFFVIVPSLKARWEVGSAKLDNEVRSGIKRISHLSFRFLASHISHLTSRLNTLSPVDIFVLILIFISTLLLIFPEFFYIKDIYPLHYRANTMFKLGYQAFMMLGIASAYILLRIKFFMAGKRKSLSHLFYNTFFILLFTLVAIYPYFAIFSYYGRLETYHGLFGLNWLEDQYPDDFHAVEWLRSNISCSEGGAAECNNQPVIAEANGDSYTDYARVSANTGLPTIVGWPVHEWLWRGSYDEAGKRIPEVATIYESEDMTLTEEVLKKYNVEYIFVGALEKEKYPSLKRDKFDKLGKMVFESGETKIYKVNSI